MPELMATLNAMQATEKRKNKFMAALQGIDLDEHETDNKENAPVTIEQVQARAAARLTGNLELASAIEEGLTPNLGVEYKMVEGTEIG